MTRQMTVMGVGVAIGLAVVLGLIISDRAGNTPAASNAPATPSNEKDFQAAVGGALLLRKSMRDPESFKVSSALVMGAETVCYEYRSRNGFGGMSVGQAVLAIPRAAFKTNEMSGFSKVWNKECAHKSGTDLTWEVNYALEHARS
jgi:hypothetical protein